MAFQCVSIVLLRLWPKTEHHEGRFTGLGYLFISADYRLLPPTTGREILEDIKDLWSYVTDPELVFSFRQGGVNFQFSIRSEELIVAGTSAGGLCAYLAASCGLAPPPKAILSMYGMGGDFLVRYLPFLPSFSTSRRCEG